MRPLNILTGIVNGHGGLWRDVGRTVDQLEATKEALGDRFEASLATHIPENEKADAGERSLLKDWAGKKLFLVEADQGPGMDSLVAESSENGGPGEPRELRERLAAAQTNWPEARHIVYLDGHGMGERSWAYMSSVEVARELNRSQSPADILLLNTCYGASLEALMEVEQVDYAVAAETPLYTSANHIGQLPLTEMLVAGSHPHSSRLAALAMLEVAGDHYDAVEEGLAMDVSVSMVDPETGADLGLNRLKAGQKLEPELAKKLDAFYVRPPKLSAIDLSALRTAALPLAGLGRQLACEQEQGRGGELFRALRSTQIKGAPWFSDLGGFLKELRQPGWSSATQEAARQVEKAIGRAVMAQNRPRGGERLSGLFFRNDFNDERDLTTYEELEQLPEEWKDFLIAINHEALVQHQALGTGEVGAAWLEAFNSV